MCTIKKINDMISEIEKYTLEAESKGLIIPERIKDRIKLLKVKLEDADKELIPFLLKETVDTISDILTYCDIMCSKNIPRKKLS